MNTSFHDYAKEYTEHRNDIPDLFIEELKSRGVELTGAKVADIGAGPGFLSKVLSDQGAIVDAVEPEEEFVKLAQEVIGSNDRISYSQGSAEKTGLASDTYDIVFVMRSWHWFDSDEATKELSRILKQGGLLIVADIGFRVASKMMKDSMKIIQKHSKHEELHPAGSKDDSVQLINGFPVEWFSDWRHEKLILKEFFNKEYKVKFTDQEWIARLGTSSWLVIFKKKRKDKALEEVAELLGEIDETKKHKVPHVLNVVIMKSVKK